MVMEVLFYIQPWKKEPSAAINVISNGRLGNPIFLQKISQDSLSSSVFCSKKVTTIRVPQLRKIFLYKGQKASINSVF